MQANDLVLMRGSLPVSWLGRVAAPFPGTAVDSGSLPVVVLGCDHLVAVGGVKLMKVCQSVLPSAGMMFVLLYGRKGLFAPLIQQFGFPIIFAFPGELAGWECRRGLWLSRPSRAESMARQALLCAFRRRAGRGHLCCNHCNSGTGRCTIA